MSHSSKLMAKVCHYYYRDQLTMAQIGARLGVSRHKVGRLLNEALETGVVNIEIRTPFEEGGKLERQLEEAYGLKASVVVEADADLALEEVKRRTCEAGAELFREIVKEGDTIGVGWGSTTFELIDRLAPARVGPVKVVQITGGNKRLTLQFDCHEVTRRLAQKLSVDPILLHAPGIVDKKETRDLLLKESAIQETFRHFEAIDIAVVGIGAAVPAVSSTLIASGYVSDRELGALRRAGAVGDIYSYFVDDDGAIVRTEIYDRLITIGIEQIRRIPTSIGVAVGAVKARAVAAAVRGGFVNTLIVDSDLAKALLEQARLGDTYRGRQRSGGGSRQRPTPTASRTSARSPLR